MENASRDEQEAKQAHLAEQVRQANLMELKAKLDCDAQQLSKQLPDAARQSIETAKDLKYMKQRQL